jgi:hypothetical protein
MTVKHALEAFADTPEVVGAAVASAGHGLNGGSDAANAVARRVNSAFWRSSQPS